MPCTIYDKNHELVEVTNKSALELVLKGIIPESRIEPIRYRTAQVLKEQIRAEWQVINEVERLFSNFTCLH
ncbi:MAG: hypothetical protein AABX96_02405 [Nanoarchaeota archaeon]